MSVLLVPPGTDTPIYYKVLREQGLIYAYGYYKPSEREHVVYFYDAIEDGEVMTYTVDNATLLG